jgi:hypothetical protein
MRVLLLEDDDDADLRASTVERRQGEGFAADTVPIATSRRKLGDPPLIRTVRGGGYALDGGPGS